MIQNFTAVNCQLKNHMNSPNLIFASPFSSTPNQEQNSHDTPIRLLQAPVDSSSEIQPRKLFKQFTTKSRTSGQNNRSNIGTSIKYAVREPRSNSSPLELISNFTPFSKPRFSPSQPDEQESRASPESPTQKFKSQKERQSTHYSPKKLQIKSQEANEEQGKGRNGQGSFSLKPIRIKCRYEDQNSSKKYREKIKEYLVPQCQSSMHSQEIPFEQGNSSIIENKNQLQNCQMTGLEYLMSQMQALRKNVHKIQKVTEKFQSICLDTSVILSSEGLEESFLEEIKTGLMEILHSAQENNPEIAHSEQIPHEERSSPASDRVKSESPVKQPKKLQFEESIDFSQEEEEVQRNCPNTLKKNIYVTPSQRRNTLTSDRKIFSGEQRHNHSQQLRSIADLLLNTSLNSSGEVIARRMKRKRFNQSSCYESHSSYYSEIAND